MTEQNQPGVGLDVGTMNVVSARQLNGKIVTKRVRDAFLDLDPETKKSLRMSKVSYVEKGNQLVVIGDSALTMANLFKREVRRPLARGVISSSELDAQEILSLLVHNVLGDPLAPGEHCYYSVPAAPIDDPEQDVVYHTEIFRKIITEHGYTAHPMNEAMAIIYSQCAEEGFSGLAVSFGSGMCNVALSFQTVQGLAFSVARCLSKDFSVLTERGVKAISEIIPGEDKVLDGNGDWVNVLEVVNNGHRDSLLEVKLKGFQSVPAKMTRDHLVFVKSRFEWGWAPAESLRPGMVVGLPTVHPNTTSGNSYYFGRKHDKNITVATARNLGRFFGMFLGDGSCGPYSENPEFVQLAINREHSGTVDKYKHVLSALFGSFADSVGGFGIEVVDDVEEGLVRLKLYSTHVARHMKNKFYDEEGVKILPLPVSKISDQMALGILEGLFDSDGWQEPKRRTFGNTSKPLIASTHHLLNRFGIKHSITRGDPRKGGINHCGVQIEGKKDEYNVRVSGWVSTTLLEELLRGEGHQVWDHFPDFVEYTIDSVEEVPYSDDVYDLRVESEHHSFSSFGMLVHNCGDWIDHHAAKAVGSTAARMCAIKEKGVDLLKPSGREQEAIALYIRTLVDYCLDNITLQFKKVQSSVELPGPIPFVVSGGTTRAPGFLDLFKEQFEVARKKRGFPIEISEVRHATDPMTAVAEGLLVLSSQEE